MPKLRARLSRDAVVVAATVLYAAAIIALANLQQLAPLCLVMAVSGVAWISVLSSL
jgi:hypothetical protein